MAADRATDARQRAEAIKATRNYSLWEKVLNEEGHHSLIERDAPEVHQAADDVLWLFEERKRLSQDVETLTDAALAVVISYENSRAYALAIGDQWIGVPDVEQLAAALSAVSERKPA